MASNIPAALDPFAGMSEQAIVDMLVQVHRSPIALQARQENADALDDTRSWVDPNGYRLSDRLWNQRESVRKQIDNMLREGIARGRDALDMARELEGYLNPAYRPTRTRNGRIIDDGRKGVLTRAPYRNGRGSFAARRLARTEVTRAFGVTTDAAAVGLDLPVQWDLSNRHPEADICDDNAQRSSPGLPAGVYHVRECPQFPAHPMCLCTKMVHDERSEDDLVNYLRQKYDLPVKGVLPEPEIEIPPTVPVPAKPKRPRKPKAAPEPIAVDVRPSVIPGDTVAARMARRGAPKFASSEDAEAWFRANVITDGTPEWAVRFSKQSLESLQSVADAVHDTIATFGLRLEELALDGKTYKYGKFRKGTPGRSRAVYTHIGDRPGRIIMKPTETATHRAAAKQSARIQQIHADNRARAIARYEGYLNDPKYPAALRADAAKKLEQARAAEFWTVASDDLIYTTAAHESAHAVMYQIRGMVGEWDRIANATVSRIDRFAVSEYAASSNAELFAEAYAARLSGVPLPDSVNAALDEAIEWAMRQVGG